MFSQRFVWVGLVMCAGMLGRLVAAEPPANPPPATAPASSETSPHQMTATMKFEDKGMVLDAGELGRFVLDYPFLMGTNGRLIHPLVEKQVAGNKAQLTYEGGCQIGMELKQGGEIHLEFTNLPADVAFYEFDSVLDFSLYQGGVWRVGSGQATPFPPEKPAKPNFLESKSSEIMVQTRSGTGFSLHLPDRSYVRLVDNRDRKSTTFRLRAFSPVNAANTSQKVSVAVAKNG